MSDFNVKDKRLFGADGEINLNAKKAEIDTPGEKQAQKNQRQDSEDKKLKGIFSNKPAAVTFAGFVVSLVSSALVHLGEYQAPGSEEKSINLEMARQTIDILGLLEVKTKGNLDEEESELLKNLLYDLRVKFVALKA